MDYKEINDIIKAAQDYLSALNILENEVRLAEEQIENSALETERNIRHSFSNLFECIRSSLEMRRHHLLQKTKTVRDVSLKPLKDCRNIILNKIEATEELLSRGKKVVNNRLMCDVNEFNTSASFLGNLPEVPALNEVPCISYLCESNVCKDVIETCSSFGNLSTIAPIQIRSLLEKPGSILVEWHCIENEDKLTDVQEFRLQKAFGNVLKDKLLVANFGDIYTGSDYQYLIKDLQINQSYSFRVCCRFKGSSSWSPWSLPQVSETSIKAYTWKENELFNLRNDNKIASPRTQLKSVLFSDGAQFHVGYSIEFTFLECDARLQDTFVGITYKNNENCIDNLTTDSFLLEANGNIYVNGIQKTTKLPAINVGSKVCFTCNQFSDTKILINIDSADKRVTYDWTLNSDDVLYFLAIFNSSKWKIMVD